MSAYGIGCQSVKWLNPKLCILVLIVGILMPNARTDADTKSFESKPTDAVVNDTFNVPSILMRIGGCESGNGPTSAPKQFEEDGTVRRGVVNPKDVGALQINEHYWLAKSKELGYDIYTLKGNLAMGVWIYEHHGTGPWTYSKHCWKEYG